MGRPFGLVVTCESDFTCGIGFHPELSALSASQPTVSRAGSNRSGWCIAAMAYDAARSYGSDAGSTESGVGGNALWEMYLGASSRWACELTGVEIWRVSAEDTDMRLPRGSPRPPGQVSGGERGCIEDNSGPGSVRCGGGYGTERYANAGSPVDGPA